MLVIHCWDYWQRRGVGLRYWRYPRRTQQYGATSARETSGRSNILGWPRLKTDSIATRINRPSTGTPWRSRKVTFTSFLVKSYASIVVSTRCHHWSSSKNKETWSVKRRLDGKIWLLASRPVIKIRTTHLAQQETIPQSKIFIHSENHVALFGRGVRDWRFKKRCQRYKTEGRRVEQAMMVEGKHLRR